MDSELDAPENEIDASLFAHIDLTADSSAWDKVPYTYALSFPEPWAELGHKEYLGLLSLKFLGLLSFNFHKNGLN